jgi:hypothetical protein
VLLYTYTACLLIVILLDQLLIVIIRFDCVVTCHAACVNSNQVCRNEHVSGAFGLRGISYLLSRSAYESTSITCTIDLPLNNQYCLLSGRYCRTRL